MPQTFVFEELDHSTQDYLLAVRTAEGDGAPGVFAPTSSSMVGCGCILGPIMIIGTLVLTLTNLIDVVYEDPVRVAFLQTAGLLIGGWLLFAAFRTKAGKNSPKMAGYWVYVDPLHLYEAYREQVTITRIDQAIEANFTHNYNNGTYQNSVVRIVLPEGATATVTLNNEQRAQQMVVFVNYLAWARGPDGGERAHLPPARLGALAKYFATHDIEPKDHEGNINFDLVSLTITTVPEEPKREGRAAPNILPYIIMLLAAIGIFFLMSQVINPPVRDAAIYEAVIKEPCEPWFLRLYLLDERNTAHRDRVLQRLGQEYDEAIAKLQQKPGDANLRKGMIELLQSLKGAAPPIVSLQVTELTGGPPGAETRVTKLRDGLVGKVMGQKVDAGAKEPDYFLASGGIMEELAILMPPVTPPPGVTFPKPRTPRGIQMIEFAEKPAEAAHAHFEVTYTFTADPKDPNRYLLSATVEIRTDLDGKPVATYTKPATLVGKDQVDAELTRLQDYLLAGLVGKAPPAK